MRTKNGFLYGAACFLMTILGTYAWAADSAKPLSLKESIDIAFQRSVLLHAAREGISGAEAQKKEAFTGFLPKVSTSYSYTRFNQDPYFVFPGVPPLIPPGKLTTGTKDNYNWSIEVRQPLFAGGSISANYEANRLTEDIVRTEEVAARKDLVQEVTVAYFAILKNERILDVAEQSVVRLRAHRDMAQGFYDAGMIPRNELLAADVELANGLQLRLRTENGLEMAKSKFNTLLRREISAPVEIEDILREEPLTTPLETCIAEAMKNRPEIRASQLRVEQARSVVRIAESEYYPTVSLAGNYSKYGDTPGVAGSPYKDQESWYVMGVANWSLWEWGKTKNRVDVGRSRENQAADVLTNLRDQITLDVKSAFLLLHEALRQVQVTKATIVQAEENFRINTERYREQIGTATDVIDAETLLTRARSDYFSALGDLHINRARLKRAMGTGGSD